MSGGVWFFYFAFTSFPVMFFNLSGPFLGPNIHQQHVSSKALTPGCICWKEAKGTQPVVDGDNHQALVNQHLRSEIGESIKKHKV